MKNPVIVKKLDNLGRVTLPVEFRRIAGINDNDEIEILADRKYIILKKHTADDVFGNNICMEDSYEYNGRKISGQSIVELAKMAGLLD